MIEQLILDIKGVLYNEGEKGKKAIHASLGFIRYLRNSSTPFILATNITSQMPSDIVSDLNNIGFELSPDDVTSSVDLSVDYLKEQGINRIFLISDNEKLREFYKSHGIDVVDYGSKDKSEAVVAALDKRLYSDEDLTKKVTQKAVYEINNGAELVALHRNMFRVDEQGKRPNVGHLVEELEKATGYSNTVTIGKPSEMFYLEALKKLASAKQGSQDPRVTLVVGDDPVADLSGANNLGMHTAFVRSGKYSELPEDIGFKPEFDVECAAELIPAINK